MACGTYSGDPSKSAADQVRFLVGDTRSPFLLSDEEILALLADSDQATAPAAAAGADALAARFAGSTDVSSGGVRKAESQKATAFRHLAKRLRRTKCGVEPWAGGLSKSEIIASEEDTDLVQPTFSKGMHDNPRATTDPDD